MKLLRELVRENDKLVKLIESFKNENKNLIEECQKNIDYLKKALNGKVNNLLLEFEKEMK